MQRHPFLDLSTTLELGEATIFIKSYLNAAMPIHLQVVYTRSRHNCRVKLLRHRLFGPWTEKVYNLAFYRSLSKHGQTGTVSEGMATVNVIWGQEGDCPRDQLLSFHTGLPCSPTT